METKITPPTFEQCARNLRRRVLVDRYNWPIIGKLTIPEIKPGQVYGLLQPVGSSRRDGYQSPDCSRSRMVKYRGIQLIWLASAIPSNEQL